jgi:hypothetical protein
MAYMEAGSNKVFGREFQPGQPMNPGVTAGAVAKAPRPNSPWGQQPSGQGQQSMPGAPAAQMMQGGAKPASPQPFAAYSPGAARSIQPQSQGQPYGQSAPQSMPQPSASSPQDYDTKFASFGTRDGTPWTNQQIYDAAQWSQKNPMTGGGHIGPGQPMMQSGAQPAAPQSFAAFAPGAARSTPPPSRGTPYGSGATPGYMAQNSGALTSAPRHAPPTQSQSQGAPRASRPEMRTSDFRDNDFDGADDRDQAPGPGRSTSFLRPTNSAPQRPQPSFTSRMTDQSGNPTTPQQYYPQLANMVGQFQRGFASAPGGTFTGRGAPQANFQRPPQFNVQQMWANARPSSRSAPGGMTPRALPQGWMY